jgi:7,8-dihydropterin-6-yl-methyl-4-(beta-D-ribofuranosyl)aminobenzene 5'-phosphate synthase
MGFTDSEHHINITIAFDNNLDRSDLTAGWGFSCLIQLPDKLIMFDTGSDGEALLHNMSLLGIAPEKVNDIILSHFHFDHIGGLPYILKNNRKVTLYMPASFPRELKLYADENGIKYEEINTVTEIHDGVFLTGELGNQPKEQALAVRTAKGMVVITGCAHPGIVNIAKHVKGTIDNSIHLLLGGFHLLEETTPDIQHIADNLPELGVEKVAPCHCSGEIARKVFSERYTSNYIDCATGTTMSI